MSVTAAAEHPRSPATGYAELELGAGKGMRKLSGAEGADEFPRRRERGRVVPLRGSPKA